MVGDDGRGEKTRKLQAALAIGRDHHRDLDALIAQSGDASSPFAFDGGAALQRQTEFGEEGDGVIEDSTTMPMLSIRSSWLWVMVSSCPC